MVSSMIATPAVDPKSLQQTIDQIHQLRQDRNAVILAHNYQRPEVQNIADYVGDSLGLARQAMATSAEVIVFAGVHFMAETAAILNPDKRVLLPNLQAGCSLAETITAEDVRAWRQKNPDGLVVVYVNTSAAVKAEADYCATSSNAVAVISQLPEDRPILFAPDAYLTAHVQRETGRDLDLWLGECHVHAAIRPEDLDAQKAIHPNAEFLIHPECGCASHAIYAFPGSPLLSTSQMVRYAQTSSAQEFIVVTETDMIHRLEQDVPGKRFYPIKRSAQCEYMKMITLDSILSSLQDLIYPITVPHEIAARARLALERMVAIG
jgi:quinolinate synthase